MRRRPLWLPALLSALALATVVAGIAVGHFYWTSLRDSMGRMDSSMSLARERQQGLVEQLARSEALVAEGRRQLGTEAEALRRREEALEVEREALAREYESRARERLAQGREQARRAAHAIRLSEAARLVDAVREGLARDLAPTAAAEVLNGAALLLAQVDDDSIADLRARLSDARDRLAAAKPADRSTPATRLAALRERALRLSPKPYARPPGGGSPARGLARHLDAARFALERGDDALYRRSLDTSARWIDAFFDPKRGEAAELAASVRRLQEQSTATDTGPIEEELAALGDALRAMARKTDPGTDDAGAVSDPGAGGAHAPR